MSREKAVPMPTEAELQQSMIDALEADVRSMAQMGRRIAKLEAALLTIAAQDYEPIRESFTEAAAQIARAALAT